MSGGGEEDNRFAGINESLSTCRQEQFSSVRVVRVVMWEEGGGGRLAWVGCHKELLWGPLPHAQLEETQVLQNLRIVEMKPLNTVNPPLIRTPEMRPPLY